MKRGEPAWRLTVLTGNDTIGQERLTRSLYDDLQASDNLRVRFMPTEVAPGLAGAKGGTVHDVALLVSVAAVARPASHVLIALVTAWCAKERQRTVELSYEGNTITLSGRPDKAQEQLVREFLDKAGSDENDRQDPTT